MDYFIGKIRQNERNMHFLLYCYTFFIMGAILNGLGPLIPYLSSEYGIAQTQYSTLFLGRTLGYMIGAVSTKLATKKFQYHTLMAFAVIGASLSAILFNYCSNIYWQTFYIGINNVALAYYDVIANTSLLIFNKDRDKQFWVQIAHSLFGVGNLVSPIMVYFAQINTFFYFGLLNLICFYGYYVLQSPQIKNLTPQQLNQIIKQPNREFQSKVNTKQIMAKQQNIRKDEHKKAQKSFQISQRIKLIISTLFFFYLGHELTFGTWAPSYSVLMNFSQKTQATLYSFIYYFTTTISRFVLATMPTNNQSSKRIKLFLLANVIASIFGLFFHFTYPHFGCYFLAVLYGITMAPLFSLYFVISNDYGFQLKDSDYSTIMIMSVFGQATFATLVGYLLQISLSMLFYSMLVLAILQYYFTSKLQEQFDSQLLKKKQKLLLQ